MTGPSIFDAGCSRTSDGGVRFGDIRLTPRQALLVEQTILEFAAVAVRPPLPDPWHAKQDAACREIEVRHKETGQSYADIVRQMCAESAWREHFLARSRTRGPQHVEKAVLRAFQRWRNATAPPGKAKKPRRK